MRHDLTRAVRSGLLLPLLLLAGVLAGCGGGEETGTAAPGATGASAPAATATGGSTGAACPTENTRSFAKTRFAADLGGAAFLTKRYIYDPYQAGTFQRGANGRTAAIVKAGLAAAASAKLLSNARENAQANPTLCRTIAQPLGAAITALGGVAAALASGDLSVLGSLGPLLDNLRGVASQNGIPVPEREVGLNGS